MPKAKGPKPTPAPSNPAANGGLDTISAPVVELIELYAQALPDVAFPGIDSTSLDALAGRVRAQTQRAALAQAEVDAARHELGEARAALREASKRALAYAKVYAEGDAELLERVKGIRLTQRKLAPERRRKGGAGKPAAEPTIHVV